MVKISVIIPVFNAAPYLSRCIRAIASQKFARNEYEVIMCDNNSTDASVRIIRKYSWIRCIHEAKQGPYAARNRAVCEASGVIIAFTDADCAPHPSWLAVIARTMKDSDVGIVLGRMVSGVRTRCLSVYDAYEDTKAEFIYKSDVVELYHGRTCNMAVRRGLFNELGGFVERPRGGDSLLVRRAVDLHSPEVVRYVRDLEVRHLEIDSIMKIYKKRFIYGRSVQLLSAVIPLRSLGCQEQIMLFLRTVCRHGYSGVEAALLLSLLGAGMVYWKLGRLSAVVGRRFSSARSG